MPTRITRRPSLIAKGTALLGSMALLLAACTNDTNGSGGSNGDGVDNSGPAQSEDFVLADRIQDKVDNGEKLTIKLSYHDPSLAFAAPISEGMAKAGDEFDVDVQLIGPAGGDAAKQVSEIQTLITQGNVDGIAVSSASNDALKPVIKQAYDAGIPVISFNTNNPDSLQLGFVGQDLRSSGVTLADELLTVLDGETGDVVVVSVDTGAGWSNDRYAGFEEALEDSGLNLIGPVNTGNEPSAAYNTIESTMAGNSDAVAIASLDCCSFTAAGTWIKQYDKVGEMHLIGFDLQSQTVENVKGGVADFTIGQAPQEQGYQAVKVLHDFIIDGEPITDVDTGADIYTSDNIDSAPEEG